MQFVIALIGLLVIASHVGAQNDGDTFKRVEFGDYVSTITNKNRGDGVELRDNIGNLVLTSEIFLDLDIEVDKPTDRDVCFLSQASSNATCFNESPVTVELPDEVRESCKGRELVQQEPADCDDENPDKKDDAPSRDRRATFGTCCRYNCYDKRVCLGTRCCRRFLGICIKRCCSVYDYVRVCSRKCIYGAYSQY